MELGLRGKKALVTGASKGIGGPAPRRWPKRAFDVVLVARTAADLEAARAKIAGEHNVAVRTCALDLSDSRNVDRLAADCADTEILVNNAGAIPGGNIAQIDEARWREAWDLKVFGYINMTRRFYALMAGRKAGVIVNIFGAAGENPDFDYVAGSSGNASLMAFTRAIGGTAPRDGLRVIGVNPGPVMTERLITLNRHRAQQRLGDPERWQELCKATPSAAPPTRARSPTWSPFSPPTAPATRPDRSSRSTAAAPAEERAVGASVGEPAFSAAAQSAMARRAVPISLP